MEEFEINEACARLFPFDKNPRADKMMPFLLPQISCHFMEEVFLQCTVSVPFEAVLWMMLICMFQLEADLVVCIECIGIIPPMLSFVLFIKLS